MSRAVVLSRTGALAAVERLIEAPIGGLLVETVSEAVQVPSLSRPLVERIDRSLYARAVARTAAGVVMVVGFASVVPFALMKISPAAVFGATLLIAGFAYLFLRLAVQPAVTERATAVDPMFGRSFAWLGVGIALLAPLTVQILVFSLLGDPAYSRRDNDLANWVVMSLIIVGAAHAALACMTARRAVELANGEQPRSLGSVYGLTVAWGCVPGVVLFLIPPILVGLTGLAVMPILWLLDLAVIRERELRLARGVV